MNTGPTFTETLKQAMSDWDAATPEQREEASRYAAELAARAAKGKS